MAVRMVAISKILRETRRSVDFRFSYEADNSHADGGKFTADHWAVLMNSKAADAGFGALCDDLEQYGMVTPICWSRGTFGNGHHRFVAALLLGWDEVPVDSEDNWELPDSWGNGEDKDTRQNTGVWDTDTSIDLDMPTALYDRWGLD